MGLKRLMLIVWGWRLKDVYEHVLTCRCGRDFQSFETIVPGRLITSDSYLATRGLQL
jgi:hypothetical protein